MSPFVIEADEYDTAFFDKRSKFVHYRPRTAILNNLEFDHADIFENLAAIEKQFHHLVRIMPSEGLVVANGRSEALERVLAKGCWSALERFDVQDGWMLTADDEVLCGGGSFGRLRLAMPGPLQRTQRARRGRRRAQRRRCAREGARGACRLCGGQAPHGGPRDRGRRDGDR